jgi:hypothetical protein
MGRFELKSARNGGGVTERCRNRRLRPILIALEVRALLSTLMVTDARDDGSPGTLRSAIIEANNGTATLNRVLFSGNRALVGGGLSNDSTATLTNVLIHGNRSRVGSSLFNTRRAIFHWRRALVDRPRQARNSIEPPARTSSIISN